MIKEDLKFKKNKRKKEKKKEMEKTKNKIKSSTLEKLKSYLYIAVFPANRLLGSEVHVN